ncbi:MAG TPA: ECF-type sigma factor [Tahibacter sp.]|uniref:ECF-type sigma factor n=1 Tax=Tahibacter sp. TaxID=2056211 RepID=UPI002CC8F35D|nr:ECF-type sigma factor [Tahibacter sp.]HSX59815.1 ECF-type sigma factor [Tahibacter sp.]
MVDTHDVPDDAEATARIAELLQRLLSERTGALAELFAVGQADLRRIARHERRLSGGGETLSTTALVNEVYMKLRGGSLPGVADRRHFYALAGRAMRQVLVDYARGRLARKRGSGLAPVAIDDAALSVIDEAEALGAIELADALDQLERVRPRLAQVVYLRFYAGMSNTEIGSLLAVEESTVRRDWLKARGWLYAQLHPDSAPS